MLRCKLFSAIRIYPFISLLLVVSAQDPEAPIGGSKRKAVSYEPALFDVERENQFVSAS